MHATARADTRVTLHMYLEHCSHMHLHPTLLRARPLYVVLATVVSSTADVAVSSSGAVCVS